MPSLSTPTGDPVLAVNITLADSPDPSMYDAQSAHDWGEATLKSGWSTNYIRPSDSTQVKVKPSNINTTQWSKWSSVVIPGFIQPYLALMHHTDCLATVDQNWEWNIAPIVAAAQANFIAAPIFPSTPVITVFGIVTLSWISDPIAGHTNKWFAISNITFINTIFLFGHPQPEQSFLYSAECRALTTFFVRPP
ncbi:hypothetical protein HWV62_28738 [Athelia sp. TMB]|nr:hypothetical protein HWV62_28738 [Athelia sp. TMB]